MCTLVVHVSIDLCYIFLDFLYIILLTLEFNPSSWDNWNCVIFVVIYICQKWRVFASFCLSLNMERYDRKSHSVSWLTNPKVACFFSFSKISHVFQEKNSLILITVWVGARSRTPILHCRCIIQVLSVRWASSKCSPTRLRNHNTTLSGCSYPHVLVPCQPFLCCI